MRTTSLEGFAVKARPSGSVSSIPFCSTGNEGSEASRDLYISATVESLKLARSLIGSARRGLDLAEQTAAILGISPPLLHTTTTDSVRLVWPSGYTGKIKVPLCPNITLVLDQ